jgi:hypothetical protein
MTAGNVYGESVLVGGFSGAGVGDDGPGSCSSLRVESILSAT